MTSTPAEPQNVPPNAGSGPLAAEVARISTLIQQRRYANALAAAEALAARAPDSRDALYLFAILPAIDGFVMLCVVLAPPFLLYGWLAARPSTSGTGMALAANGATLMALQSTYSADFASFAESNPALFDKRLLGRHYSARLLASPTARTGWVEPDLAGFPWRQVAR